MKALLKKLILSTSLLGLLALPALAECPRGDLDKRYCDVNGDLIADTPTDPSKLVDPDTLIFAYTPVEDPAVYRGVWADFLDHMEKVTGKKVVFFQCSLMQHKLKPCVPAVYMLPDSTPVPIQVRIDCLDFFLLSSRT